MKRLIPSLITALLLTSCAPKERIVTSIDGDRGPPSGIHNLPRGCYVMKKRDADVYECFGCVGDICNDEDLQIWDYTGQEDAEAEGFTCGETKDGCVLVES